jgi:hypothetical protein
VEFVVNNHFIVEQTCIQWGAGGPRVRPYD